jgi:hypothetical protein
MLAALRPAVGGGRTVVHAHNGLEQSSQSKKEDEPCAI